ncbi:MAG: hypothetical protein Q4E76_00305 [Tissierellia bacterium]|nr:hypothetical protein [Tissierellia bacterium]
MPQNYEEQLRALEGRYNDAKSKKERAQWRLDQLEAEERELLKELEALGLKPEELETTIKKLEGEIEQLLQRADELIPKDLP